MTIVSRPGKLILAHPGCDRPTDRVTEAAFGESFRIPSTHSSPRNTTTWAILLPTWLMVRQHGSPHGGHLLDRDLLQ